MQLLEVEPQSKLVEEEVKNIVGVEPHVVQNKSTKAVFEKLETHDVI